jgi:hypothetical protein
MQQKLAEALPMTIIHHRAYRSFTQGLSKAHAHVVKEWYEAVIAWENDMSKPCPYEIPDESDVFPCYLPLFHTHVPYF